MYIHIYIYICTYIHIYIYISRIICTIVVAIAALLLLFVVKMSIFQKRVLIDGNPISSVLQPPRNKEFTLLHKDRIGKPRKFKVLSLAKIVSAGRAR